VLFPVLSLTLLLSL
jgi:hypothetical protein